MDTQIIEEQISGILPPYLLDRVMRHIRDGDWWRCRAKVLEARIEYLEQHVPPEIKSPARPAEPYRPHRRND